MKKVIALLLVLVMVFAVVGCGSESVADENDPDDKIEEEKAEDDGEKEDDSDEKDDGDSEDPDEKDESEDAPAEEPESPYNESFELYNGFIKEVKSATEEPEGYIPVYTFEDFISMREEDNLSKKYILMNDIVCEEYEPLSLNIFDDDYYKAEFSGVINGNGYKVSGVTSSFFHSLNNAVVENLGLEVSVTCEGSTRFTSFGVIALSATGSTVDNCYITGEISGSKWQYFGSLIGSATICDITHSYNAAAITYSDNSYVMLGGLVGNCSGAQIVNCYNEGVLTVSTGGEATVGGLAGEMYAGSNGRAALVSGSYNAGMVDVTLRNEKTKGKVGGIVGYITGDTSRAAAVNSCWNKESVLIDSIYISDYNYKAVYAGGIIGYMGNSDLVSDKLMNTGDIYSVYQAGGIVGYVYDLNMSDVCNTGMVSGGSVAGGIIGEYSNEIYRDFFSGLTNCLNTGEVFCSHNYGGIVGYTNYDLPIADGYCYYTVTDECDIGGTFDGAESAEDVFTQISSDQLEKSTFENFDFKKVWLYDEDDRNNPVKIRFMFCAS